MKGAKIDFDNRPLEANGPQHKAEGGLDSGAVPDASTQRCPWCNEPIESEHPTADVYHLDCIMESTKHLREKKRPTDRKHMRSSGCA